MAELPKRVDKNEQRTARVIALVSHEEKTLLDREAERRGLSASAYLRSLLLRAADDASHREKTGERDQKPAEQHMKNTELRDEDIRTLVAAHAGVVSVNELAEGLRLNENAVRRWAREHGSRRIGSTFAFNLDAALACMRDLIVDDAEEPTADLPDASDLSEESLPPGAEYPRGLTVEEAAPILRLTAGSLWSRLRHHERDGKAHLGPGISAARLGKTRTWRVFIDGDIESGKAVPARVEARAPTPTGDRAVLGESELDTEILVPYRLERRGEGYAPVGLGEDWPGMDRDIAVALRDALTRAFMQGSTWKANEIRKVLGLRLSGPAQTYRTPR